MNVQEYRRLKKQAEEQRKQAVDAAEKTYIEAVAAIETVWRIEHPQRVAPITSSTSRLAKERVGSLAKTIRDSLQYVPPTFTRKHIIAAARQVLGDDNAQINENSLSGCLYRLRKDGVIREVRKGRGRTPSEYELVKHNDTESESAEEGALLKGE
jgi:hypothetical protein